MTTRFSAADNFKSRYRQGGTTETHPLRLGWWERKTLAHSDTDVFVTLDARYHHRPWVLAFDVYGDERLEWVVLQYNGILDTTTEFVSGVTIRLPTEQRLKLEIFGS